MASVDVLYSPSPILGLSCIGHDTTIATSAEAVFAVGEETKVLWAIDFIKGSVKAAEAR